MTVDVVASGSSGNLVVLNGIIALDIGVPYRKMEPYVKDLKLVFVSHRHGDHFKESTIRALAHERPNLRFAGGRFLEHDFLRAGVRDPKIDVLDAGQRYNYGVFEVEPVELFHDVPCYGLKIFMGREKAIYVVDTGYIDHVEANGFDLYMVEANHTEAGIAARIADKQARGEFSYETRAQYSHLSYEQAMDWLVRNAGSESRYILLHRSKQEGDGEDEM